MRRPALIILVVFVVIALALGAFWGGMSMGKAQAQNEQNAFFASRGFDPNNAGGAGGNGAFGGFAGGANGTAGANGAGAAFRNRGANGTIEKIDGNTITLTTTQGQTITVNVASNTPILKSVSATTSDLKPGTHILVIGDRSGNNVSATGIQITDRPNGMDSIFGQGFGGGRRTAPTPTK